MLIDWCLFSSFVDFLVYVINPKIKPTNHQQVMMPFAQGILYNLAICGWQYWNRNARVHGSSVGARLRRWWYGVNNWTIPAPKSKFN